MAHHRRHHYRRNPGGFPLMPLVLIGGAAFLLMRGGGLNLFGGGVQSATPPPGTIIPPGYTWVPGRGLVQTGTPTTQLITAGITAGVPLLTGLLGKLFGPSTPDTSVGALTDAQIVAIRDAGLTTEVGGSQGSWFQPYDAEAAAYTAWDYAPIEQSDFQYM